MLINSSFIVGGFPRVRNNYPRGSKIYVNIFLRVLKNFFGSFVHTETQKRILSLKIIIQFDLRVIYPFAKINDVVMC